jgi:uncharacterized protein YyaL (SSP411 family)
LANGLVDLYEAGFDAAHLRWAEELAAKALELFEDGEGGYFTTRAGQDDLVLRLKDDYDGAEPAGNSVLTLALLRLARMRGREDFRRSAERAIAYFGGKLRAAGPGLPQMLVAAMFAVGRPMEIVIAGEARPEMLREIRKRFLPDAVVLRAEDTPEAASYTQAGVYVCENFACQLPANSAEELANRLQ